MGFSARFVIRLVCAFTLAAASLCANAASSQTLGPEQYVGTLRLPFDMVFVSAPVDVASVDNTLSWRPGGNLLLLKQDGTVRNLTGVRAGAVTGPTVSYDGKKILFAMVRQSGDQWHLYEYDSESGQIATVTSGPHNDLDPCYLPDGRIVFASDRPGYRDEYDRRLATVLHILDRETGEIRQVSFNLSQDLNPIVTRDGRIVWTRWEHMGTMNKFPLFSLHPDGTGTFIYYGALSEANGYIQPQELPDGRVVCVALPRIGTFNSGQLQVVDIAQGPERTATPLTPHVPVGPVPSPEGRWRNPFPVDSTHLLVSWADGPVYFNNQELAARLATENPVEVLAEFHKTLPNFGLYLVDMQTGKKELVYDDPEMADIAAVALRPRPVPRILPARTDEGKKTGTVVATNLYRNNIHAFPQSGPNFVPEIPPGSIKEVRIIEGILRPQAWAGVRISSHERTAFEAKRLLGTVPVNPDGSFAVELPANTPLHFQTVGADGMALTTQRSWFSVMPGESASCMGCHEPRMEVVPPGRAQAHDQKPVLVDPPKEQATTVDFVRDVQPILDRRCGGCHAGGAAAGSLDLSGDKTPFFNVAYSSLTQFRGAPPRITRLVVPSSARNSPLISLLRAGHQDIDLTPDELRTLILWVDLGASYRYAPDGQEILTLDNRTFAQRIAPILDKRGCSASDCHAPLGKGSAALLLDRGPPARTLNYLTYYLNLTYPERSRVLTAALARPSGLSPCGQAVFADTKDPDYQLLLNWITNGATAFSARGGR